MTERRAAPTLRSIVPAERHFWREDAAEQVNQKVADQYADYDKRILPEVEVAVLALNEIAVKNRRGFFFHLPPRLAWTKTADADRLPVERSPAQPDADYPTVLYMSFRWDDAAIETYLHDSQRARYMRASAITNPPPDNTPLFAIQYAIQRCPVYFTTSTSQVVFATKGTFYHALTDELAGILGRERKDNSKLGSANWLWDRQSLDKGRDKRRDKDAAMDRFKLPNLECLYSRIVQLCSNGDLLPTYQASALRALIPRPLGAAAESVGSPFGGGRSADYPSRRGETRRHTPRKKRKLNGGMSREDTKGHCTNSEEDMQLPGN